MPRPPFRGFPPAGLSSLDVFNYFKFEAFFFFFFFWKLCVCKTVLLLKILTNIVLYCKSLWIQVKLASYFDIKLYSFSMSSGLFSPRIHNFVSTGLVSMHHVILRNRSRERCIIWKTAYRMPTANPRQL